MKNRDTFSGYHPVINFLYYALVLLFSMCLMHPVYLAVSLTGALAYDIHLKGRKAVRFAVMGLLPMAALAALVNPAFNHEGATILTYLPSGNPLTLESMLYGIAAAVMLASVVLWFSSYNEIMTSDKFVYLFGQVIPALSLVLSMAMRFIPKFKAQMQTVSEAQSCIGRDTKNGSVFRRVGNAVKIFSIMVTWSLENAIETADSMRSRGYGLPGRSSAFTTSSFVMLRVPRSIRKPEHPTCVSTENPLERKKSHTSSSKSESNCSNGLTLIARSSATSPFSA